MAWWIWMLAGAGLVTLELLAGGELWLLLAGLAAVLVGVAALAGVDSVALQLLIFSLLGGSVYLVKSRLLPASGRPDAGTPTLVGELGVAVTEIAPGKVGTAELRGTSWTARCAGDRAMAPGTGVRVVWVEGVSLYVEPE
ncbi:MAG: NfeD family protein [Acidobacteria bacterium]|nr:NfeD family protein [Acidobacteriota bacterium]